MRAKLNQPVTVDPAKTERARLPKSERVASATTATTAATTAQRKGHDESDGVDGKRGKAKAGDAPAAGTVSGGAARQSAVHARMQQQSGERIENAKQPATPETHPQLFWHGKQKWKTAPPNVDVIVNKENVEGRGWIEKWRTPDGKWVHNYTLEEMARKAGEKFVANAAFARNIDDLRAHLTRDLSRGVEDKRALTALVVAVIDDCYIRVGNESSTKRSETSDKKQDTYGITTMLGRHLSIEKDERGKERAVFRFVGKSEVDHVKIVDDPKLVRLLKRVDERAKADEPLFAQVSADDVNKWLEPFGGTAKSFRTYHATRLARDAFADWHREHPKATAAEREAAVLDVAKGVAEQLGHSPAVCLKSYIDPAVVELFVRGRIAS